MKGKFPDAIGWWKKYDKRFPKEAACSQNIIVPLGHAQRELT
jgi:hypothetical protein